MAILDVTRSVEIDCDIEVVRRQFGDVAHHAATGVHAGVVFEVIEDQGDRCRYRQVSAIGPAKIAQELELDRVADGPLVNRIVAGQFTGGSITFEIATRDEGGSTVEARLSAPISGVMRIAAPILRAQVGKQLAKALAEDKADLEDGAYGRA
jgi:hypothetical protein